MKHILSPLRTAVIAGLSLLTVASAMAERVEKSVATKIKKNANVIYGEATGKTENEAYNEAFNELMYNLREFREQNPDFVSADGILVQNIQSKAKRISYMKNVETEAVCVYVFIEDIAPLYGTSATTLENSNTLVIMDKPVEPVVEKKDEKKAESAAPKVVEQKATAVAEQKAAAVTETKPKPVVEQKEDKPVAVAAKADLSGFTTKEKAVLEELSNLSDYRDIRAYLDQRKNKRYDIMFKVLRTPDQTQNCFWIIVDANDQLVAIIDKTGSINLLNGKRDAVSHYSGGRFIWLMAIE